MKIILLISAFLAGAGGYTGSARGEVAADSVVTATESRGLIPVRLRHDGVRIRSVHDNRRIVILRPPMRIILPGPPPAPAPAPPVSVQPPARAMSAAPPGDELLQMELRLMDYLDRRIRILENRLVAAGGSAPPPSPVVVIQGSAATGGTTLLPSPSIPVTETVVPDTVVPETAKVDSVAVVPALRDTTAAPVTDGVRPFTIEPTTTVVEVERAILDNDLLRTTSVLFEFNSAAILPASAAVLNTLGIVLQRHPQIRLEIGGHSDGRGPDEYNMQLSLERATAVRDYLLGNYAIDPARLNAQGFGETRPIADDATPTGRTMNRRVEFMLIR